MRLSRETELELLKSAKSFVEKGWTQDVYAVNGFGVQCKPSSPEAVCFCTLGAWQAAGYKAGVIGETAIEIKTPSVQQVENLLHPILQEVIEIEFDEIAVWNDDLVRTQDEVIAAFDTAISRLEG